MIFRLEERLRQLEESRLRVSGQAPTVPADLSFALGTAYLRTGALESAERELREALRVRPDLAEAHNNLAAVYVGLGAVAKRLKSMSLPRKPPVSP